MSRQETEEREEEEESSASEDETAAGAKRGGGSEGEDEDYVELKDLRLYIPKLRNRGSDDQEGVAQEDGTSFTLCFWIYLLNSTQYPSSVINQVVSSDGDTAVSFLKLDDERKITLMPLVSMEKETSLDVVEAERPFTSAALGCPFERWVHVGCEVSSNWLRLHIDGRLVGQKQLSPPSADDRVSKSTNITLAGNDGTDNMLRGYVHFVRVFELPIVVGHLAENPPLVLSLDGSSCLIENNEIVEGNDGVWNVVGGKASCRRNFALYVVLLDALGRSAEKEIEIIASLVYADNGLPVEKSKDDAEAPLLMTVDGVEFPSNDKPVKLFQGHASFKLKISKLSSKCENRLFRVRFEPAKEQRYPFLVAYSHLIRCVSRSRPTQPLCTRKKSIPAAYQIDAPQSPGADEDSNETQEDGDDHFPPSTLQGPGPPFKRVKVGHWKIAPTENAASRTSHQEKVELNGTYEPSDFDSIHAKTSPMKTVNQLTDLAIFKYCLEGINDRAAFLKEVVLSASEQSLSDFAHQVAIYTGCSHNRYQILIAKRLIQEGNKIWNLISKNFQHVLWRLVVHEIERHFTKMSLSINRSLSTQDKEFLRSIAGCSDIIDRESFDRLWAWLYPVALTLSNRQIRAAWDCTSPKLIEGMVTREEAESSLSGPQGVEKPGTFLLRFPASRSWPHPDAGSLVVTYVGNDFMIHHKLISFDDRYGEANEKTLLDLLILQPELSQLGRVKKPESYGV